MPQSVVEEIKSFSPNELIIISFTEKNYRFVALNWVKFISRLNIKNYVIVSLDKVSEQELKKESVNTVLYELADPVSPIGNLWKLRMNVIEQLITSGHSVLLSDLDAVWCKNPVPDYIDKNPNYDIISSIADHKKAFPQKVANRFGFTLCMGFIYIKTSEGSIKFFNKVTKELHRYNNNDQVTVNMLLKESNPEITDTGDGGHIIKTKSNQNGKLKVLVLSNQVVQRHGSETGWYVSHPYLNIKFLPFSRVTISKLNLIKKGIWYGNSRLTNPTRFFVTLLLLSLSIIPISTRRFLRFTHIWRSIVNRYIISHLWRRKK